MLNITYTLLYKCNLYIFFMYLCSKNANSWFCTKSTCCGTKKGEKRTILRSPGSYFIEYRIARQIFQREKQKKKRK